MANPQNPTQQRLIEAAATLFAKQGFHHTSVSEICETADANIAAVNYHFGDKESLYDAVWHYAFDLASDAFPIDGSLPDNPELKDYIYSYAYALVHRIFSETETGLFAKLLHQEMSNPTLALDRIANEVLFPQAQFLGKVVHASLEQQIPEERIRLCMHSMIGQCAFFNFSRPLRERVLGKKTMNEEEMVQLARHIASFSMGGIEAVKKEYS